MVLQRNGLLYKGLRMWLVGALMAVMVVALLLTPQIAAAEGDPAIGEDLYTGKQRLSNGAPPCISCHNVGNPGALGGGTLGPTLSGKEGFIMDVWINSSATPVMGSMFSKKPITAEEAQHVQAFVAQVSSQQTTDGRPKLLIGGVVGTIILLIIFAGIWSGRYRSRNGGTAHDDLWRNYGGKGGR